MRSHSWVVTLSLVASATLLGGCSTDCSTYDPGRDQSLFKASGGLASKCYQQRVDAQRVELAKQRQEADALAEKTRQLEADLAQKQARNNALEQRAIDGQARLKEVEADLSALKNDADPAVRKAEIDKKLKQVAREIDELKKADTKAESDKVAFARELERLRTEYFRLLHVYQALSK